MLHEHVTCVLRKLSFYSNQLTDRECYNYVTNLPKITTTTATKVIYESNTDTVQSTPKITASSAETTAGKSISR